MYLEVTVADRFMETEGWANENLFRKQNYSGDQGLLQHGSEGWCGDSENFV